MVLLVVVSMPLEPGSRRCRVLLLFLISKQCQWDHRMRRIRSSRGLVLTEGKVRWRGSLVSFESSSRNSSPRNLPVVIKRRHQVRAHQEYRQLRCNHLRQCQLSRPLMVSNWILNKQWSRLKIRSRMPCQWFLRWRIALNSWHRS